MLQINKPRIVPDQIAGASDYIPPAELYTAVSGFLYRQHATIIASIIGLLALGAIYIFTTPPRYTGHAVLIIDTHQPQFFQQQQFIQAPIDTETVDTQIQILNSENIALSVIKDLHLTEDPEFVSPRSSLFRAALNFFIGLFDFGSTGGPTGDLTSDFRAQRAALETFQRGLTVTRVGLTYAIDIEFKSLNPNRAAQIANAVADAYVVDALEAKYQTTRRAAVWLQDRLKELREESANAERAVVDFKAKNNIVDTGGRLMNEQQLAELNSALIQARAMTAEAKARLDRVQQILSDNNFDPAAAATATVADTLKNDVITKLRQQYLEYQARAADWSVKYGSTHLAVVNLRNQMREISRSIFDELQRIAETYKSDYAIAKTREDSIQKSLNQIVSESQTTDTAQITLHNLESSAQTYRALYDNFLQRYMESVQQQSFPVTDARVITQATRPLYKSTPKTPLIMGLAGIVGMMLGIALGVLREISDRVFRTTEQVSAQLDVECISVVPLIKDTVKKETVASPAGGVTGGRNGRAILRDHTLLWRTVDSPFSRFAESIRAVKVAADLVSATKGTKIVGITSSLPNEGKSTIATALAQLVATGGARTLLVDCDLRNPSLTRKLSPDAKIGLLDIIKNSATLETAIFADPATKLSFLPAGVRLRISHTSDVLASGLTQQVFDRLRSMYDCVIVDLSPLAPVVDVRVMTHLVDSFVFVVEWGRTKIDVAQHALASAKEIHDNLLGVVLNKADMSALGRYENHRGNYYHNRYYARYGYTD